MSEITSFPSDGYDGIVIERNIPLTSMCSHHHQPIGGVVHIGYVVGLEGRVIGLSITIPSYPSLGKDVISDIGENLPFHKS